MVEFELTEEFFEWNEKFEEKFGEPVPLMMVPEIETLDGMIEKIKKCLDANENLLGTFYEWELDNPEIVY